MRYSFALAYVLCIVSVFASLNGIIDTDIPLQKMVMGKAGLTRSATTAPAPVKQFEVEPPKVVSPSVKPPSKMVASRSFPASVVYDFAARAAKDTFSYSARRLARDKKLVSELYAASAWPKVHNALFSGAEAPLMAVVKEQVDSLAVLLDMPIFSHTEQWEQFSIWVFKVPVLVTVYQQSPKKYVFDALLAISVEDGVPPRFVVQKALLQKRMVPQGN